MAFAVLGLYVFETIQTYFVGRGDIIFSKKENLGNL